MRRFAKNNKTMTDPIADFLTRIRNAYRAGNRIVEIPSSKMKVAITKILCEKGYILTHCSDLRYIRGVCTDIAL